MFELNLFFGMAAAVFLINECTHVCSSDQENKFCTQLLRDEGRKNGTSIKLESEL